MSNIRAIRTEADYEAALARIDALMDAQLGTPEGEELDVLTDLVELYEGKHVPMGYPTALEALRFRMEQADLSPRDLIPFIGSRAKVSEVLAGKRPLTMQMARALHANLGIPADVLLQQPGGEMPNALEGIDWKRFPVTEMARRGWIDTRRNLVDHAEEIMRGLIARAGGEHVLPVAMYRKNDQTRANAKTDPYALKAWCWEVLARANATRPPSAYKSGVVDLKFLRRLATLSWSADGPRLAREFLGKHGVALICLEHLPRTHLDGAALQLADGTPVIGLTLRYDRLDNFWFCLFHELAHIGRHMGGTKQEAFIDDLSLRDVEGVRRNPKEHEADEWAENGLIPETDWQASRVKENPSPLAVMELAQRLEIHPAIVAGRIRHETRNFRLLSHFVGTGEVRRQLLIEEGLKK
jgi:HTH-type transcriptional regulator / antitoxin HigA